MRAIEAGDTIPDLTFECTEPSLRSFKDLLGKNVVLYFYPKDNTPGCTIEGRDFRDNYDELLKLNTCVIGVSRDSLISHQKFCLKHQFPFPLISDPDEKLCRFFNVMIEKNMFKRIFLGIERSTFLIDEQGVVRQVWRGVKVKGHVNEILRTISTLR